MSIPVLVIYGGQSTEHEISCRSANFVIKTLFEDSEVDLGVIGIDKDGSWFPQDPKRLLALGKEQLPIEKNGKFPDDHAAEHWNPGTRIVSYMSQLAKRRLSSNEICVFMVTHGTLGEDGIMQGFLELLGFAYIGPDTLGSAIGMDKEIAKILIEKSGLPVVPFLSLRKEQWAQTDLDQLTSQIKGWGFPLYVKPAAQGSSVGISKVQDVEHLKAAIEMAFKFDEKILIEKGLDVREIECAALGTYIPEISRAGEVNATAEFYTFDAKYVSADGAIIRVPAALDQKTEEHVRDLSAKAYKVLQLYGGARIDWFLEKKSQKFFFNEVNTLPGFTSISQYPKLWEASGLKSKELLRKMIHLGLERRRTRDQFVRANK
jgi:D-alanine-D-alanine ligase